MSLSPSRYCVTVLPDSDVSIAFCTCRDVMPSWRALSWSMSTRIRFTGSPQSWLIRRRFGWARIASATWAATARTCAWSGP
jgi:hypothetical protein